MPSLPYRVGSYDHQELPFEVWLHNDLPRLAAMLRLDHPPAVDDILAMPRGSFEHSPEVDLAEAPVVHSLEEMWAELQLPIPPLRPRARPQTPSPSRPRALIRASSAPLANAHVHRPRRANASQRSGRTCCYAIQWYAVAGLVSRQAK